MKGRTVLLGVLLTLSGCDYVRVSFGGNETGGANETAANISIVAPPTPGNGARPADAGVTTSRSLQPLAPDGGAIGSKDPNGGAAGAAVDPAMLIGRWGDNGDCSAPIQFFGDGTFRAGNGSRGEWRVAGDSVTMSGGSRSVTLRIVTIAADEVVVRDANGQLGRSVRC